ncbi:MAG: hypothetical protein WKF79_15930 [Nocardioides sp.]
MKLKFTRSSRRHRIGRAHTLFVINNVEPSISINDRGEQEYHWLGMDDRDVSLEIAAVVVEDGVMLVLHVMPSSYRRNR